MICSFAAPIRQIPLNLKLFAPPTHLACTLHRICLWYKAKFWLPHTEAAIALDGLTPFGEIFQNLNHKVVAEKQVFRAKKIEFYKLARVLRNVKLKRTL